MTTLVLVLILDLPDAPASTRRPRRSSSPRPTRPEFPEIGVYFEVRKADGSFVRDADRDEFRVTEDGRERPITGFEAPVSTVARPTTVVLVVDRSGSMREDRKMAALRRAVGTFLDGLPEGSRVAVVAFGSDVRLVCPFTTDRDRVRRAIDGLEPFGATRYYDAVIEALHLIGREPGRRAVLALTDGQDTDSERTIDAAIAEGRRLALCRSIRWGSGRGGRSSPRPWNDWPRGRAGSRIGPTTPSRSGPSIRNWRNDLGRATRSPIGPTATSPMARSDRSGSFMPRGPRRARGSRPCSSVGWS